MCNELNVKSPATLHCSVQQTNLLLTIPDCCAVLNQNLRIIEFRKTLRTHCFRVEEATVEKIIHGWLLSKELPAANALSEEDDNASQHFDCDCNKDDNGRLLETIVHTNKHRA